MCKVSHVKAHLVQKAIYPAMDVPIGSRISYLSFVQISFVHLNALQLRVSCTNLPKGWPKRGFHATFDQKSGSRRRFHCTNEICTRQRSTNEICTRRKSRRGPGASQVYASAAYTDDAFQLRFFVRFSGETLIFPLFRGEAYGKVFPESNFLVHCGSVQEQEQRIVHCRSVQE